MLLSSLVPLRTTYAFVLTGDTVVLTATTIFYKMPFVKSHCDSLNHFVNHYSVQMSKLRLSAFQDPGFVVVVCLFFTNDRIKM